MKTNYKPQSILYPQPVLVIASYDKEGRADAMVAAWGGIYDTNRSASCWIIATRRRRISVPRVPSR